MGKRKKKKKNYQKQNDCQLFWRSWLYLLFQRDWSGRERAASVCSSHRAPLAPKGWGVGQEEKSLPFTKPERKASDYCFKSCVSQTALTISFFFLSHFLLFKIAYLKISTWQTSGEMRTHAVLLTSVMQRQAQTVEGSGTQGSWLTFPVTFYCVFLSYKNPSTL